MVTTLKSVPAISEEQVQAIVERLAPGRRLARVSELLVGEISAVFDLATFFDEPLDAPAVPAVADKTYCVPDPASDCPVHFPGEVVVHLKNGQELRLRKPASLGRQEVPLSRAALEEKFLKNATRTITPQTAEKLIARIYTLGKAPSLSEVMALCTADALDHEAAPDIFPHHEVRQHA